MNKKERQDFLNKILGFLPQQKGPEFIEIMTQIEDELTNLRKKAYSIEFAKKRAKTLYLNNPEFMKFIEDLKFIEIYKAIRGEN